MTFKSIYTWGDKLEDKVRGKLSHYPIIYAFIGGTGIIIFWRGVWHSMDYLTETFTNINDSTMSLSAVQTVWWDGPASILVGMLLLLTVGLFVTSFIGNEIIISGLKKEKKITEKTEDDIKMELSESNKIVAEVHAINERLKDLEKNLKN